MHFEKNELTEILNNFNIPIIENSVNYWFIRTNGGDNFENFYFNNYVAIGWDKINTLDSIKSLSFEDLKASVEELYPNEGKPGSIASQIKRFVCEMKVGDYVLIPGANCDRIAIGIIVSDAYTYVPTDDDYIDYLFDDVEISYLKRRNVSWITDRPFERSELDPLLIPIIYSYGAIVNANPYAGFINRTLYNCYVQNDEMHAIFDVTRSDNIPAIDLYNFMNTIFECVELYSDLYDVKIDRNEFSIKAAINSPGPVEIITCATSAFIVLSALSLFVNGAKVNFSFDILNIVKGEVDINSPGLIDRIAEHNKISNQNQIELKQTEAKIIESKEKLKLRKKQNKK